MGLDTSHDCWHGAYSAFTRWRTEVARVAGYTIVTVDGHPFAGEIQWDRLQEKNYTGQWDRIPEDPLIILLAHSDCDGEIRAEHCGILADRLKQLLPLMLDGEGSGHIARYGWRGTTQRFIDGLRQAAAAGEAVDFH